MSDFFNAKMHQIRFPRYGAYSAPQLYLRGPTSKGREREGRGRGGEVKGEGRGRERRGEGKRRVREGRVAPNWGVWIRHWREGQEGELGLGRPGTSFFHFKHCVNEHAARTMASMVLSVQITLIGSAKVPVEKKIV